jgi:hypothetical protein
MHGCMLVGGSQVDNTKVFYIWIFGSSGAVCSLLVQGWHYYTDATRRGIARVVVALVFVSLVRRIFLAAYHSWRLDAVLALFVCVWGEGGGGRAVSKERVP